MRDLDYRRYVNGPLRDIPRFVFEDALWRCSKRDRELILGWWDAEAEEKERERRWERDSESRAIRDHQRYRDLEVIVRDQRNHIANLEAQLLPHLVAEPVGIQEALA